MSLVAKITQQLKWLLRSSTLRLSIVLSAIFGIGMAAAIFVALEIGEDVVLQRIDTTLETLASSAVLEDAIQDSENAIVRAPNNLRGLPDQFEQVVRRGGGTVDLNRAFRRSDLWRVLVSRDSEGTPILVAVPLEDSFDSLELLGDVLWTTAGVIFCLTLAIGVIAGLFARRRVVQINKTLNLLAGGDLTARTGRDRSTDDLDDIALQLDQTAGELERLVSQTRNLSASIAHDLRTPLARLRANLEMLPDGEERGAALEEANRLSGIFDTIMRVARIEAAQGQDGFEPVDLSELLYELAEIFGPVIEDDGKTLVLDTQTGAPVLADRQMLVQAMANLIQNALVYGGPEITLFVRGREIGLFDNGEGVDPAHFDEIVKPMVRLDATRASDGSGLGLALVRAVADRHAAQLVLSQNKPSGLRVTLKFAEL